MKTYQLLIIVVTVMGFCLPLKAQWTVQHSGLPDSDNPTLIFSAVNQKVCWAIQLDVVNPKCIVTANGGDNWNPVDLQHITGIDGLRGMSIFALNADTAWIALDDISGGSKGGVFKTTNAGNDWVKQETAFASLNTHPQNIYFFDARNGLAVGMPKDGYWEIYTTEDGGINWTRVPKENIPAPVPGNQYFPTDFLVSHLPKGIGQSYMFCSLFRSVYITTDRGHTWSVVRNVPSSYGLAVNIAFKDSLNGLACSFFGERSNQLAQTTDGGATWKKILPGSKYPSNGIINYVPGTEGTYIITCHKNVGAVEPMVPGSAYTLDNGNHWTVIDSLPHGFAAFTTGNVGWSAGNGDTIFKWNSTPPDTAFNDIIPQGAMVKKLSDDQFYYINGPVWYQDSVLLFSSDNPASIYSYYPRSNQFSMFRKNTGSNGLTLDKNKNLLACTPKIVMLDTAGQVVKTLAHGYNNKAFNSPNDIIADKWGGAYFSDISFFGSHVQDKEAVYYVDSTGMVTRVVDELIKPNGLVLSKDSKKLYVDDSFDKYLYSFDVAPDGSLSGKTILAELKTKGGVASGSDGMAIDIHGNLYVCSDVGIQVFSPGGDSLAVIAFPERPSNCDFGGENFKTLFVTTNANLYSIELNYQGYAVSRIYPGTAVNPVLNHLQVKIYPNPVKDYLYIQHNLGKVHSIEIYSLNGKKETLVQRKVQETSLEMKMQHLKSGMYLLKIVSDAGVLTRKFIKE